ncbi:MAG: tRNA (adenosine(37)-N6)-dimethylallyltransferase MiaA [Anaerolineales bacterium]|nr:tRNA (adenosine(37)-N6)-dimethylallyltransferase MiaA [Anaerolineales bacterium]
MSSPEILRPPVGSKASAELPCLVVILGPTAVGKTELAILLAERLGGEIISADSRLFYRGLDIGTAKPTPAERRRVRHHLIDVAEPNQTWSLAMFQQQARQAITSIYEAGRLPFLVGGTGQYLRAVTQGWSPPPVEADPRLREALQNWAERIGADGLHTRLAVLDPQAAASIDARNLRRTVRALEVILSTGRLFSAQRTSAASPYHLLQVGLTRSRVELYARIDARLETMLANGWVEEVSGLLRAGYTPDLPCMSAIGYREIIAYLEGKLTLEEALIQIKRLTRVFVRRQANWFKPDDPQINWFRACPGVEDQIEVLIRRWLPGLL